MELRSTVAEVAGVVSVVSAGAKGVVACGSTWSVGVVLASVVSFGTSVETTGSDASVFCPEALFEVVFRFLLLGGGFSGSAVRFPRGVLRRGAGSFGVSLVVLVMSDVDGRVVDLF